jgi:hypothetical protein
VPKFGVARPLTFVTTSITLNSETPSGRGEGGAQFPTGGYPEETRGAREPFWQESGESPAPTV